MLLSCATNEKASLISHVAAYLLNAFLQGIFTVQMFKYYMDRSSDKFRIKLTIYVLCILEVAHTAITLYDGYTMLALHTERTSGGVNLLGISGYFLAAMIALIAQCFYAFRIHRFSRNRWLAMLIVSLSAIQLVLGISVGVHATLRRWRSYTFALQLTWFAAFALCDAVIAVAMVALLRKSPTRVLATRRLVRRVLRLTIETGVITTGASVLCLALRVAGHPYFLIAMLSLPKLYSITLLVQLNNRPRAHELQFELTENTEISHNDSHFK